MTCMAMQAVVETQHVIVSDCFNIKITNQMKPLRKINLIYTVSTDILMNTTSQ